MKISKADLASLINEVIDDIINEQDDKYTNGIKVIDKKITNLNINVGKLKLNKAKLKLAAARDREKISSDALDAAEDRGADTSKEEEKLNTERENVKIATDGLSAANNNLKAVQKGGSVN